MEGSMFTKGRVAALVAEFLGTAILTLSVLYVITSQIAIGYFVAIGAGLVFFMLALVFGGISKTVFNPAISLGLWTIRKLTTKQTLSYIAAQMLGALAAFTLYEFLREGDFAWGNQSGGFDPQVLVAEIAGTAVFAFGFAAAMYKKLTGVVRATVFGASLTAGILIASLASFGLLNPAIAFSAQTWELTTYVLGPVLGAILGLNIYNLLFQASVAPVGVSVPAPVVIKSSAKTTTTKTATKTKAKPATKPAAKTAKKKSATKK